MGFLVHGIYEWFPSMLTTIFPVNESLFEHVKLIVLSSYIGSTILYFIFKFRKKVINNFSIGLLLSTIFNVFLFYLVYLPIYYLFGQNMAFTLIWYFISIGISQIIFYLIISRKNTWKYNFVSIIIMILSIVILTYFTYHPIKTEFFRDPEGNYYGIKK